jgi:hypothetical protein
MTDTSNQVFVAIGFPRGGHEGIERHFADHRKEFRGITIEEYENKAIALLNSIPDGNIEGFTDIEDCVYRYNKERPPVLAESGKTIQLLRRKRYGKRKMSLLR